LLENLPINSQTLGRIVHEHDEVPSQSDRVFNQDICCALLK